MLTGYDARGRGLAKQSGAEPGPNAVWIDLLNPTKEEEQYVEYVLKVDIPTREEVSEIEVSSRLYHENGAHFMTATILHQVETPDPQATIITFILTDKRLITLRYAEPRAFPLFLARAQKGDLECDTPLAILLGLLESIIDREADLIERLQAETEKLAQVIFEMRGRSTSRAGGFDVVLKQIGRIGEITSRARESLLSLGRLFTYVTQVAVRREDGESLRQRIRTEDKDVQSLTDHVHYLTARINFMLDASVGMVTIEQNQIIKLFSVAAVMLMPPTLVASIYGMNFRHMPEITWEWGYPLALVLMGISALLPYIYFRRRGWL